VSSCSDDKTPDCGCEATPLDTNTEDVFDFDLIDPNSDIGATASDGADGANANDDAGGVDGEDASTASDGSSGSTSTDGDIIDLKGQLGDPCSANNDCESGWCVEGQVGFICTQSCVESCPDGYSCKGASVGGQDIQFLCVPTVQKVCTDCVEDTNCNGGACLSFDGSQYCAAPCETDDSCPAGFSCTNAPNGEKEGNFCIPSSGSCSCTIANTGEQQTCQKENELGTCFGVETCDPDIGWVGCTATEPTSEICDGQDNDCDGLVDEELATGVPCQITVEGIGTCQGTEVCFGPQGVICQGASPEAEVCDFKDNDCDGETDEDFKIGGQYASFDHCGTCFASCQNAIANAAETSCAVPGGVPQCVVDECLPGYTQVGVLQCVSQLQVNCAPCITDDDCNAPDAACLNLDDGNFCATSCGAESACPLGYTCNSTDYDAPYCVPESGSCTCDGTNTSLSQACAVTYEPPDTEQPSYTCEGLRNCTVSGWSECNLPVELCDGADNNCDGEVDETFKNGDGKYWQVENCGGCNISCLALVFPNAVPICDASGAFPQCAYECASAWVDVNGDPSDGCECLPEIGPDFPGDGLDTNCDGIDGEADNAIFVAKNGSDQNPGTFEAPVLTITEALDRAIAFDKRDIYVATGVYSESIILSNGIRIIGGYRSDFLARDPLLFETAMIGIEPTEQLPATVSAVDVGGPSEDLTVFDGFTIFGANAANIPGGNSYGIYMLNCGDQLVISNNRVFGGAGGFGQSGLPGQDGLDGGSGQPGVGASDLNKFTSNGNRFCTNNDWVSGGSGGQVTCGDNITVTGGAGGTAACPDFSTVPPNAMTGGQGSGPSGAGGVGGWASTINTDDDCGFCGATANAAVGGLGLTGLTGNEGTSGAGCSNAGGIVNGQWQGGAGAPGGVGAHGGGGGGGGAGGGVEVTGKQCIGEGVQVDIAGSDLGGSGGGGGSGGCAGTGGTGGTAGGGSFGIFVVYSAPAETLPVVLNNVMRGGAGGPGGSGGPGGAGGNGGIGAAGGNSGEGDLTTFCANPGGPGGAGGAGGHGAGGGGGCGGASYGLYVFKAGGGQSLNQFTTTNTFLPGGAGGIGGPGGSSPGQSGASGSEGTAAATNF
jgi:hypothetical protein